MRVDEKVTRSMTQEKMLDYVSTLVEMNEKITKNVLQKKLRFSSSFFFAENRNVLSYRVQYLLESKQKKKTNKGILLFLFMLPVVHKSSSFLSLIMKCARNRRNMERARNAGAGIFDSPSRMELILLYRWAAGHYTKYKRSCF